MPDRSSPGKVARAIRAEIKRNGSPGHASGVQWFFKEEVKSRGWYTGELRAFARKTRREILDQHGLEFLVQVADKLFTGGVLEEKIFAVLLLENLASQLHASHFELLESWISRISSWADQPSATRIMIVVQPGTVPVPSTFS